MTRAECCLGTWGRPKDSPCANEISKREGQDYYPSALPACRPAAPIAVPARKSSFSLTQRGHLGFHSKGCHRGGNEISPRTLPIFKNGGNTPHGSERATLRAGVTSGSAPHWAVGAGAAILGWARAFAQTQHLPERLRCDFDGIVHLEILCSRCVRPDFLVLESNRSTVRFIQSFITYHECTQWSVIGPLSHAPSAESCLGTIYGLSAWSSILAAYFCRLYAIF